MKNSIKLLNISFIICFLSSCQFAKDLKNTKDKNLSPLKDEFKKEKRLEISIACGDGNIQDFIDKGWRITKEFSEEKVCSWKSVPANNKCDMKKDKGCKITKPDKIGIETFYLLEK